MYMKTDQELLDDFQKRRNLKPSSMRQYRTSLKLYSTYNEMSLEELLQEAETEEDERIPQRRRTLLTRLLDFRNFLTENYKKKLCQFSNDKSNNIILHLRIRNPKTSTPIYEEHE